MTKLVAIMVALALLVLFGWWALGGEDAFLSDFHAWHSSLRGWAWLILPLLLAFDVLLPLPSTLLVSASGLIYGAVGGALIGTVGFMLAGLMGYAVGRMAGERRVRALLGTRDFERSQQWFARYGLSLVAVSRAVPILPEVVSVTAGLLRVPLRPFVTALLSGSLPVALIFAWLGAIGHDAPHLALGSSIALPLVLWLSWQWLGRKRAAPTDASCREPKVQP